MPLINGNFADGLRGWSVWERRGHPRVNIAQDDMLGQQVIQFESHNQTFEAGLLQGVSGGPLARFTLSAWVRFLLSDPTQNPDLTAIRAWVGIDPAGGTHPDSSGIVAVSADVGRLVYERVTVTAESVRGDVTVFAGVEAGVNDQWRIANLIANISSVELDITPGNVIPPMPPPASAPEFGIVGVQEFPDAFHVTMRWPKVK